MGELENYYGAFGSFSNAKTYEELDKKVSSKDGTTLYIGQTKVNASINDAFTPVEPEIPEVVADTVDKLDKDVKSGSTNVANTLAGPYAGESNPNLKRYPTYEKNLSFTLRDNIGNAVTGMLDNKYTEGVTGTVSDALSYAGTGASAAIKGFDAGVKAAVSPLGKGITKINEYLAPTVKTLNNFAKLGDEFDKIIAKTFWSQLFGIKGSEILCTAFCILISLLPCSTRNKLYEAVQSIKATMYGVQQSVSVVNQIVGVYNTVISSANSVAQSAQSLFGNKKTTNLLKTAASNTSNVSTIAAAPAVIKDLVGKLTRALQIITKAKITLPVGINGDIWDIAQCILFAIQAMVVGLCDELLTKIIKPIEKAIKDMVPEICVGNMAYIFFNKIIMAIRAFKSWILQQIAELFGSGKGFGLKWKTFGIYFSGLVDLLALMQALNMILNHFFDLAMACGLSPCKKGSKGFDTEEEEAQYENLTNSICAGKEAPMTNINPAIRHDYEKEIVSDIRDGAVPQGENLDIIVAKLAPIIKVPAENIIMSDSEIKVIYPGFQDVPTKIAELIASEQFAQELGPAYTIYSKPDGSSAKIVYTFKRSCGE